MFTGTEQLVAASFEQVAGQLRLKGKPERALADKLIQYGQALAPLVWLPGAGGTFGRIASVANAAGIARVAGPLSTAAAWVRPGHLPPAPRRAHSGAGHPTGTAIRFADVSPSHQSGGPVCVPPVVSAAPATLGAMGTVPEGSTGPPDYGRLALETAVR
jgi:hypothetical protein